jgi:hypothetical protein
MNLSSKQITLPWFIGAMFTLTSTIFTTYSVIDHRLDKVEQEQGIKKQRDDDQDRRIVEESEARKETNKKLDTILMIVTEVKVEVAKKEDKK